MKRSLVLFFTMLLCSCVFLPQKGELSIYLDRWIGQSASDLVVADGAPFNIYALDSGWEVYEYFLRTVAPSLKDSNPQLQGSYPIPYWWEFHRNRIRENHKRNIKRERGTDQDRDMDRSWHLHPRFGHLRPRFAFPESGFSIDLSGIRQHIKANSCLIQFQVDADNIIKSWSHEGNGCRV